MNYWFYHYLDRYLGIPLIFSLLLVNKIKKLFIEQNVQIKKILAIKLTMMGDTILLYPAIKALKEKFSYSELTVLCSKVNLEIVKMWDFVDEIIVFEFDKFYKKPWSLLLQIFKLYRKNFDLAIDFEQWFRITSIIAFISSKYKIGFKTPKQYRHYLFDIKVSHIKNKHEVESFCDVVKTLGVDVEDKRLFLKINENIREKIKNLLKNYDIEEKKFVIIHPGCGIHGFYRQWDIDRYAKIAEYIATKYGCKIVITGNKDDIVQSVLFKKFYKLNNYLDMIGKTNLEELIALVSMAKFLICGNTGVLHIAAALNTPTIAIHGPTDPDKWGPWGEGHVVVKSDLDCVPCSYLGFEYKCKDRKCLKAIQHEEIKLFVDEFFK
ncbi:MAG: glycosyltransferase family 9 protein [Endomicrobiia bacterium]